MREGKRTEFQKKRSGMNNNFYKNLLLGKQARGTATESELNWISQNFREPEKLTVPPLKKKFNFFKKGLQEKSKGLDTR